MNPKIGEGKYTQSTFDDDFYKLSMMWAYLQKFPDAKCIFEYQLRKDVQWPTGFGAALNHLFNQYGELTAPRGMDEFLFHRTPFLPLAAIDYFMNFRYNPNLLQVFHDEGANDLRIKAEGPIAGASRWEIPVLATVSELYFEMTGKSVDVIDLVEVKKIAKDKGRDLSNANIFFADFGTRRRHSFKVHDEVVQSLKRSHFSPTFVGTSNVHLAQKHDLKVIGTTGHEWHQFHSGVYGYKMANFRAMENWQSVYEGNLGIVLPDTFTTDVFLKTFNAFYAKLYDGPRWDSGDYREFTKKFADHYTSLGIDTNSKVIVYSDGINSIQKARDIKECAKKHHFKSSLGIGTWLTCDVPDVTPLSQVMKMTQMKLHRNENRWTNVIKISDTPGKKIGDKNERKIAFDTLEIPQEELVAK